MKAKIVWKGDMLMEGTSEQGHSILMDGHKQLAASPMEAVLLAAGGCSSIDVTSILEKARQDITGCEVELEAERADGVPAVFTSIHLNFIITGNNLSDKHVARAVSLSIKKYCSVSIMLSQSVAISHSYQVRAA